MTSKNRLVGSFAMKDKRLLNCSGCVVVHSIPKYCGDCLILREYYDKNYSLSRNYLFLNAALNNEFKLKRHFTEGSNEKKED